MKQAPGFAARAAYNPALHTAECRNISMMQKTIPVIDLFAGPGGLGEGFSRYGQAPASAIRFDLTLSVEKDPTAYKTLRLRALYRLLEEEPGGLDRYQEYVRLADRRDPESARAAETIASGFRKHLDREVPRPLELGVKQREEIDSLIRTRVPRDGLWVLLGGPPCQAYSLVGRSRMRSTREDFHKDPRHYLYREYLHVIARFQPAVFVMENVKGILSSRTGEGGDYIFRRILADLSAPAVASGDTCGPRPRYRLATFSPLRRNRQLDLEEIRHPSDFIVRAEEHGIPQSRHRVIILGIREDLSVRGTLPTLETVPAAGKATVSDAIRDLPPLPSRLSRAATQDYGEGPEAWARAITDVLAPMNGSVLQYLQSPGAEWLDHTIASFPEVWASARRRPRRRKPSDWLTRHRDWFRFQTVGQPLNHQPRSHITEDLGRYFFAAAAGQLTGSSPKLSGFPPFLRPKHRNVRVALEGRMFADRFRVQLWDRPATTVTSHISKDGHYYIHPDYLQCRSLTVREAARLQTFPDDYFFEGPRTQQYHQVGNAVPPLLAFQLAGVVARVLEQVS